MAVKYFKVTSDRLNSNAYYAAYSVEEAKKVTHSDFNSQIRFEIEEVLLNEIPNTAIVHAASLEYKDAHKLCIDRMNRINDPANAIAQEQKFRTDPRSLYVKFIG